MDRSLPQPDARHLSVFTASLATALLVGRFVHLPIGWEAELRLPGLVIPLRLTTAGLVALLMAALSAGGSLGMIQRHPNLPQTLGASDLLSHAVLPSVSAWGAEALLQRIPPSPLWIGAFVFVMGFVLLVLLAEFVAVDPSDRRYPLATAMLNALGFLALFLFAYTLHTAHWRIVYLAPALGVIVTLVSLRALRLKHPDRWRPVEAVVIAVVTLHPAAAWRYLPWRAMTYSLWVLAVAYAATLFVANLIEGQEIREALKEPLVSLVLFGGAWLWLG